MNKKLFVVVLVIISLLVGNLFVIKAEAAKKSNTYYRYISAKCSTMQYSRFKSYSKSFGKGKIKFYKMVRQNKVSCGDYSKGLNVYCSYQHAQSSIKPKDMNDVKYYPHDIEDLASFQPYAKKRVNNGTITRESLANHIRGILVNTTPYLSVSDVKANFEKWCKSNSNCNGKLKKGTIKLGYIDDGSITRAAAQIAVWSYANGDASNRSLKCDSCSKAEVNTANEMYDYFRTRTATNSDAVTITGSKPIANNGVVTVTITVKGNTLTDESLVASECKAANGAKLSCSVKYDKTTNKGTLTVKNPDDLKFHYVVKLNGNVKAIPVAYIPYEYSCSTKKVCTKKNKKGNCTKYKKQKVCSEHATKHQEYVGEPSPGKANINGKYKVEGNYEPERETLACPPEKVVTDVTCTKDATTSSCKSSNKTDCDGNVIDNIKVSRSTIEKIFSADPKKYTQSSIDACKKKYCSGGVCCSTKVEVIEYNGGHYRVDPEDPEGKDKVQANHQIVFQNKKNGQCIVKFALIRVTKTCYVKSTSCPTEKQTDVSADDVKATLRIAVDKDWKELGLTRKEETKKSTCKTEKVYSHRTTVKEYSFKMPGVDANNCYRYTVPKTPDTAVFIDLKVEYGKNKKTNENKDCMLPKGATCPLSDPCLRKCDYVNKAGARCINIPTTELKQHCPGCTPTPGGGTSQDIPKTYDLKNIYYRTIDTENVFPKGSGKAESLWFKEANKTEIPLITEAQEKIQLAQQPYSGTPKYSVTLTPDNMKAIREYNNTRQTSYTKNGKLVDFINEINNNGGKNFIITGTGGSN